MQISLFSSHFELITQSSLFHILPASSTVNLANFPPDITLNTFIREHAQLTATKFMCLEGGCGVCVCVVRDGNRTWAVNSVSVGIAYLILALYTH